MRGRLSTEPDPRRLLSKDPPARKLEDREATRRRPWPRSTWILSVIAERTRVQRRGANAPYQGSRKCVLGRIDPFAERPLFGARRTAGVDVNRSFRSRQWRSKLGGAACHDKVHQTG